MLRYSFKAEKFDNFFDIAHAILTAESAEEITKLRADIKACEENSQKDLVSIPAELVQTRQNLFTFFRLLFYIKQMQQAEHMPQPVLEDMANIIVVQQKFYTEVVDFNAPHACYIYLLRTVMYLTANVALALLSFTNGKSGRDISSITFLSVNHAQYSLTQVDVLNRKMSKDKIDVNYDEFVRGFSAFVNDVEPASSAEKFFFILNRAIVDILIDVRMSYRHNPKEIVRINAQLTHLNLWQKDAVRNKLTAIQRQYVFHESYTLDVLCSHFIPQIYGFFGRFDSPVTLAAAVAALKKTHEILEKLYLSYLMGEDLCIPKNDKIKACIKQLVTDISFDAKFLLAAAEKFPDQHTLIEEIRIIDANVLLIESCVSQEPAEVGRHYFNFVANSFSCTNSGLLWKYKPHLQFHGAQNKVEIVNANIVEMKQSIADYNQLNDEPKKRKIAKMVKEQYISCLTVANARAYQELDARELQDQVRSLVVDEVADLAYDFLASMSGVVVTIPGDMPGLFEQIKLALSNLHRCRLVMTFDTFADFVRKARTLLLEITQGKSSADATQIADAKKYLDALDAFCRNDHKGALRYISAINHADKAFYSVVQSSVEINQEEVTITEYFELAIAMFTAEEADLPMLRMRLQSLPVHPNILLTGKLVPHQAQFTATIDLLHILLELMYTARCQMLGLSVSSDETLQQEQRLKLLQMKSKIRPADTGLVYALKCIIRFSLHATSLMTGAKRNDFCGLLRTALLEARNDQSDRSQHEFIYDEKMTSEFCDNLIRAHSSILEGDKGSSIFHIYLQDLNHAMLGVVFAVRKRYELESIMAEKVLRAGGASLNVKKRYDCLARIQRLAELDAIIVRWNLSSLLPDQKERYLQYQSAHPLDKMVSESITVKDKVKKLPELVTPFVFGDHLEVKIKHAISLLMKRIAMLEIVSTQIFIEENGANRDNVNLAVTAEHDCILREIDLLTSDILYYPELTKTLAREKEVLQLLKYICKIYLGNLNEAFPNYLLNEILDFKFESITFDSYMNADIAKCILTMLFKRFDFIVIKSGGLSCDAIFKKCSAELEYLLDCHKSAVSRDGKLLVSRFILEYFYLFALTFRKLGYRQQIDDLTKRVSKVCAKDSILPLYDILLRSNAGVACSVLFGDICNFIGKDGGGLLDYYLASLSSKLYQYLNTEFNCIINSVAKTMKLTSDQAIAASKIINHLFKDNQRQSDTLLDYIQLLTSVSTCEVLCMNPVAIAKTEPAKIAVIKPEPVIEINPREKDDVKLTTRTIIQVDTSRGLKGVMLSLKEQFDTMRANHRAITGTNVAAEVLEGVEEKLVPVIKEVKAQAAEKKSRAITGKQVKPVYDIANADFAALIAHCHANDADQSFLNIAKLCLAVIDKGSIDIDTRVRALLLLAEGIMYRVDEVVNMNVRLKYLKILKQYLPFVGKNAPEKLTDLSAFIATFDKYVVDKTEKMKPVEQAVVIAEDNVAEPVVVSNSVVVEASAEYEVIEVEVVPAPVHEESTVVESDVPNEDAKDVADSESSSDNMEAEYDLASETSANSDPQENSGVRDETIVADPVVVEPFNISAAHFNTVLERCHDINADTEFANICKLLKSIYFDGSQKKKNRLKAIELLANALLYRIDECQDVDSRDKVVNFIKSNQPFAGKHFAKLFARCLSLIKRYQQQVKKRTLQQQELSEDEQPQMTPDRQNDVLTTRADLIPAASIVTDIEPSQRFPTPQVQVLPDQEEAITIAQAPSELKQPSPQFDTANLMPVAQLNRQVNTNFKGVTMVKRSPSPAVKRDADIFSDYLVPVTNRLLQKFVMKLTPLQQDMLDDLASIQLDAYLYDDSVCSSLFRVEPGHMKLVCFASPQYICMLFNTDVIKLKYHVKDVSIALNQQGLVVRLDEVGLRSHAQRSKAAISRADLIIEIACLNDLDKKSALQYFCYMNRLTSMLFWSVSRKVLIDVVGNANSIAVYPEFHMQTKFTNMPVLDLCDTVVQHSRDNREIIFDALIKLSRHHQYLRFGMLLNNFISECKHELRDNRKPPFMIELFDELFLTHCASIAGRYMKQDRPNEMDLDILYDLFPMLNPEYESDFRQACADCDALCRHGSYHGMTEAGVNHARANFFTTAFYRSFMQDKNYWDYLHERGQQNLLDQLAQFLYQMPFDLFSVHNVNLLQLIYHKFMQAFEQQHIPGFYHSFVAQLNGRTFELEQDAEFKEECRSFLFQTGVVDNQWIAEKAWLMHVHVLNQQVAAEMAQAGRIHASPRLI